MMINVTSSRWFNYSALAAFYLACSQSALGAGQAHVHGHGKLLIAQEGKQWQLEFNLPGADVVGFEHAAQSEQDKAHLQSVVSGLASPENVFTTRGGECQVSELDIELPKMEHHDTSTHQEHHGHSATHQEHDENHAEVRLRYHLACSGELNGIVVTLFDMAPSLREIDAQWIVSTGQGQADVSSKQREVLW